MGRFSFSLSKDGSSLYEKRMDDTSERLICLEVIELELFDGYVQSPGGKSDPEEIGSGFFGQICLCIRGVGDINHRDTVPDPP